jgi:curved DNA-binding protein CbpA
LVGDVNERGRQYEQRRSRTKQVLEMHTNKDPYQLLGIPREASEDDIQRAHLKLVREYHPDTNPEDPRAEERFKEIQQAYEVLSDNKKRREYDKRLHASSTEASVRPDSEGAGAKTRGGAAHGTAEGSDRERGPMFKLGYLLGIVLVALVIALPILFILGTD